MKLTRGKRIALELLGPPILGAMGTTGWALATLTLRQEDSGRDGGIGGMLPNAIPLLFLYLMGAFLGSGFQAFLYAAIMEWSFARGLDPRSCRMVAQSTVLGWAAGAAVAFGYGYARDDTWYLFNTLGPLIGLILGLAIRRWSPLPITGPAAQ
jgi:hypothetical protein